jgi:Fur family ferric uptake transcriptional regulator
MQTETKELKELKEAGLKITAPRLKILKILEQSKVRHLSAEDVYRLLLAGNEEIGLATVYRVLTQFESAGLVIRHNFDEGHSVFELKGAHHDHIVCIRCGHVEEFSDREIEKRQHQIAEEIGFTMSYHSLNLYGLCPDCAKAESQSD